MRTRPAQTNIPFITYHKRICRGSCSTREITQVVPGGYWRIFIIRATTQQALQANQQDKTSFLYLFYHLYCTFFSLLLLLYQIKKLTTIVHNRPIAFNYLVGFIFLKYRQVFSYCVLFFVVFCFFCALLCLLDRKS